MKKFLPVALFAVATVFLIFGLLLPIIRFDRLYFFSDAPSLFELVSALWTEGDLLLALLVGTFSIGFPIAKLVAIGVQISSQISGRGDPPEFFRRVMPHLSKWSMMDVMLVAIVIFAAKSSGLAQAVAQPGLWFYAGSALIAGILPSLATGIRQDR